MKRILFPIDFSTSHDQLVKYAVHMAQDTAAKLVLLPTHSLSGVQHTGTSAVSVDTLEDGPERLAELCDEIRSIYHVPTDYLERSGKDEMKNIIQLLNSFDLLLLGVKQDLLTGELVNGNSIFKILREASCPVLLIPADFNYHKISRILYALDPESDHQPPFEKLKNLAQWFNAEVRFLSIVKHYTPSLEQKMDRDFNTFQKEWGMGNISFDYVYYEDVPKCLDHYVKTWLENDVILFTIHTSSLIESLFHKSVVKEIASCAAYPILTVHR
ncbi:MAG: universal stress protein [Cyclobacteriaceae bacterium]|nr:universal stress protein [Cyclobacteriaceae bacterium]